MKIYTRTGDAGETGLFGGARVSKDEARVEAFVNVCPHRGAVIVRSARGNALSLRCPYHGNTYDLHGRLVNAVDHERPAELALRPIRSATWGGWCWLNTDRDAGPIEEFLGFALQDELEHWDFEHVEVKDRRECVGDFNWKSGVEAFLESLHVAHIHSRTVHPVVDSQVASFADLGDHSRMAIPFRTPLAFADDGADWWRR